MVFAFLFLFLGLQSVLFAGNVFGVDLPFEKIAIVQDSSGTVKKIWIKSAKKVGDNYEFIKTDGILSLVASSQVKAIVPVYPAEGIRYSPADVKDALEVIRALPHEYQSSESEVAKWEQLEALLANVELPEPGQKEKPPGPSLKNNNDKPPDSQDLRDPGAKKPATAESLTNPTIMAAEELYALCSGPQGNEWLGRSVLVHGEVDSVDTFNLMDGFTKPRAIKMVGGRKPSGGKFHVRCEIQGPVVFLEDGGNLYARLAVVQRTFNQNQRENRKITFFTVDNQEIHKVSDPIQPGLEFALVNKGNRLLIAQKMKISGFSRLGDLDLVGANIQKDSIPWDEIQSLAQSRLQRSRAYGELVDLKLKKKKRSEEDIRPQDRLLGLFVELEP